MRGVARGDAASQRATPLTPPPSPRQGGERGTRAPALMQNALAEPLAAR